MRLTIGEDGGETVTLTESLALPPAPLQARLKVLFEVNALMVCEPDAALIPDHAPEAVQLVASTLLQLNVVEPFVTTLVGFADRETVGSGEGPFISTKRRGRKERSELFSEAL